MMKRIIAGVLALFASATISAASTVMIDFEGSASGGIYEEDGFTFTSNSPGGVSLSTCPPTGGCLQLNNNETITVAYLGGLFDVMSFTFRSPGSGGDLTIASNVAGSSQTISESLSGNDMQQIGFPNDYNGILTFSWTNLENGSGRVDNLSLTIAPVPLPAAGLLLLAAIGGLSLMRRRAAVTATA